MKSPNPHASTKCPLKFSQKHLLPILQKPNYPIKTHPKHSTAPNYRHTTSRMAEIMSNCIHTWARARTDEWICSATSIEQKKRPRKRAPRVRIKASGACAPRMAGRFAADAEALCNNKKKGRRCCDYQHRRIARYTRARTLIHGRARARGLCP